MPQLTMETFHVIKMYSRPNGFCDILIYSLLTIADSHDLITDFHPSTRIGETYSMKSDSPAQFEWIHSNLVHYLTAAQFRVNISGYNADYTPGQAGFYHAISEIKAHGWYY